MLVSSNRSNFVQTREKMLAEITTYLLHDERFVAAWLAGSYGRGEQKWQSDIDIHIVVADEYSNTLCSRDRNIAQYTTPERLALFSQFGTPAIVFDSHGNNFMGGSFTYVAYAEGGHNVDWMLIPQAKAHREHASLLLFDRVGLPGPPEPQVESMEECIQRASDQVGFFWMIAASNALNLLKNYLAPFHMLMMWLEESIRQVEAALKGERAPFTKKLRTHLYTTPEEQAAALLSLCDEMEALMPLVAQQGGHVPPINPRTVVEKRLALLHECITQ